MDVGITSAPKPSTSAATDATMDVINLTTSEDSDEIGSDIFLPFSSPSPPYTPDGIIASASTPVNDLPQATVRTPTPIASPARPPPSGSFRMDESVNPWKVNREFRF